MDYWTALQHRGMLYAKCPDEVWIGAAIAGHDGVRELAGHERACGASRTALKGGGRRGKAGEGEWTAGEGEWTAVACSRVGSALHSE